MKTRRKAERQCNVEKHCRQKRMQQPAPQESRNFVQGVQMQGRQRKLGGAVKVQVAQVPVIWCVRACASSLPPSPPFLRPPYFIFLLTLTSLSLFSSSFPLSSSSYLFLQG